MNRLREWMWTVPPPPALDEGAEVPKELASRLAVEAVDTPEDSP
jgi:NADH-quinone oxidoreductase subunit I